jgi:hypothetical protein
MTELGCWVIYSLSADAAGLFSSGRLRNECASDIVQIVGRIQFFVS